MNSSVLIEADMIEADRAARAFTEGKGLYYRGSEQKQVERYLASTFDDSRAPFSLLLGVAGCGRTSVAKHFCNRTHHFISIYSKQLPRNQGQLDGFRRVVQAKIDAANKEHNNVALLLVFDNVERLSEWQFRVLMRFNQLAAKRDIKLRFVLLASATIRDEFSDRGFAHSSSFMCSPQTIDLQRYAVHQLVACGIPNLIDRDSLFELILISHQDYHDFNSACGTYIQQHHLMQTDQDDVDGTGFAQFADRIKKPVLLVLLVLVLILIIVTQKTSFFNQGTAVDQAAVSVDEAYQGNIRRHEQAELLDDHMPDLGGESEIDDEAQALLASSKTATSGVDSNNELPLEADSFLFAMQQLFALWQVNAAFVEHQHCLFAGSQGLACLNFTGPLGELLALNLPALVELNSPVSVQYAVLLGSHQGRIKLLIDGNVTQVSEVELTSNWTNKALILWHPPSAWSSIVHPGDRSPIVKNVRDELQYWLDEGQLSPSVSQASHSDVYDDYLVSLVEKYKRESGLRSPEIDAPLLISLARRQTSLNQYPRLAEYEALLNQP